MAEEKAVPKKCGSGAISALLFVFAVAISGCELNTNKPATRSPSRTSTSTDTSSGASTKNVVVSWSPNREKAVNTTGGGYRVYFSTTSPVTFGTNFVTAAFSSGGLAPTTAQLSNLSSGTYFIQVVAFSALSASGSTSTETSVVVP